VPASEFNTIYDEIKITPEMERLPNRCAGPPADIDLADNAFVDAVRSHVAVSRSWAAPGRCHHHRVSHAQASQALPEFFDEQRQPDPCGCENDLDATLTLMLCTNCFGRGGFQHNPDFDTAATCIRLALHVRDAPAGSGAESSVYDLRPFFHQMPKTLAMDVHGPPVKPLRSAISIRHARLNAWPGR